MPNAPLLVDGRLRATGCGLWAAGSIVSTWWRLEMEDGLNQKKGESMDVEGAEALESEVVMRCKVCCTRGTRRDVNSGSFTLKHN